MEHYLLKNDEANRETYNRVSTKSTYDKYISMYIERMNIYGFETSMETSEWIDICARCESGVKYYFQYYCAKCEKRIRRNRKTAHREKRKKVEKRLEGLRTRTDRAGLPYLLTFDDFVKLHQDFNNQCTFTKPPMK